jgi:hypothetical protein
MDPVRAHAPGQRWISRDQQFQPPAFAEQSQCACAAMAVGRAEMAIDDSGSARQPPRDGDRIGRARGVGEEKQGRKRWRTGGAIEPARFSR